MADKFLNIEVDGEDGAWYLATSHIAGVRRRADGSLDVITDLPSVDVDGRARPNRIFHFPPGTAADEILRMLGHAASAPVGASSSSGAESDRWMRMTDMGPANDWFLHLDSIKGVEIVATDPPELQIVTVIDKGESKDPPAISPKKISVFGPDAQTLYDLLVKSTTVTFTGLAFDGPQE